MNASPTGSRAATSAPNANSRMASVIGTVSCSALSEVVADRLVRARAPSWRSPNSSIRNPGCALLLRGHCVEDRLHVVACDLADLAHLELDERRVTVAGDESAQVRVERGADRANNGEPPQPALDVTDGAVERRRADGQRPVLHEHRLPRLLGEVGVLEDRLRPGRLARARVRVRELLRPHGVAEEVEEGREAEPGDESGLPVGRAPAAGAGGEVHGLSLPHTVNPPSGQQTSRPALTRKLSNATLTCWCAHSPSSELIESWSWASS